MASKAKEPLLQFVAPDWLLATKRWGPNMLCPTTGEKGCGIYFPDDGSNFNLEATDGKSAIVIIKGDRNAPPDPNKITTMLQIYGGKPAFQAQPDKAYINLNPTYDGPRYMGIEDYEAMCAERNIPVHTPTTLLDTYLQSIA